MRPECEKHNLFWIGSARTSLIITIGPSARHHAETTSTIMFGQRVSNSSRSLFPLNMHDEGDVCSTGSVDPSPQRKQDTLCDIFIMVLDSLIGKYLGANRQEPLIYILAF